MKQALKTSVPGTLDSFDLAAAEAEKELPKLKTAKDVKAWYARWYMTAGHKRLGRLIVNKL